MRLEKLRQSGYGHHGVLGGMRSQDRPAENFRAGDELNSLGLGVIEIPQREMAATIQQLSDAFVEIDSIAQGGATPDDPYLPYEWHLQLMDAPAAWEVSKSTAATVIALVDSGVDASHPDLTGKVVPGWSFLNESADTSDVYGHGTAVAGAAVASTNNSTGIAGLGWNATIMPLVVLDANNQAKYTDIARAIVYAADRGVRIINVSLGGTVSSATLQSAVDYAWRKGAMVFAAAMNDSASAPVYPAACSKVIAISATDADDTLSSFSNRGSWITLAAPGRNILTTSRGGGYAYWWGTSMSSSIVSALAALVLAVNPALTADQVCFLLKNNSDDLGDSGYDSWFGWGRVNALKTVNAARDTIAPPNDSTPAEPQ